MIKIKYAIFDVGQTIYPFTLRPLYELMKENSNKQTSSNDKHTALNYNYNPYMKGELTDEEFAKDLCSFCHVSYKKEMLIKINQALHQGCGANFPETLEAMQKLKSAHIKLGILSNALPLLHDTKIDFVKPEYAFTSYHLKQLKPDTRIYELMAAKLNVPYEQILFIDDKEKNITAAQKLGINGIVYNQKTILKEITAYLPIIPLKDKSYVNF